MNEEYPNKRIPSNIPSICVRNRQELDDAIKDIIRDANSTLYKTIRRDLSKYPEVRKRCEVDYICSEVYIRAFDRLHKQNAIPNIAGWTSITARHIILEKNRALAKQDKNRHQAMHVEELSADTSSPLDAERNRRRYLNFEKLVENLDDPLDKAIIQLMRKELKWKEICQQLISQGLVNDINVTQKMIERIKKKGNRVKERLRNKSLDIESLDIEVK